MKLPACLYDYRYTWLTVGLFVVLVPAFVLTTFSARLEPYPALVLPSGAWLSSSASGVYHYDAKELAAREPGGRAYLRVDLARTFPDFDATRLTIMMDEDLRFGRDFSGAQNTATRDWLRERLTLAGYAADTVVVRKRRVGINAVTGLEEDDELLLERVIPLD